MCEGLFYAMQLKLQAGISIEEICEKSINLARTHLCRVEFGFNDVDMVVKPDSKFDDLIDDYHNRL